MESKEYIHKSFINANFVDLIILDSMWESHVKVEAYSMAQCVCLCDCLIAILADKIISTTHKCGT